MLGNGKEASPEIPEITSIRALMARRVVMGGGSPSCVACDVPHTSYIRFVTSFFNGKEYGPVGQEDSSDTKSGTPGGFKLEPRPVPILQINIPGQHRLEHGALERGPGGNCSVGAEFKKNPSRAFLFFFSLLVPHRSFFILPFYVVFTLVVSALDGDLEVITVR